MPSLPTSLALASIADGSSIVAADHRNNYAAIQTDVNSLITALGAGAAGQFLAGNGSTLSWLQPPGTELVYTEFFANVTVSGTSGAQTTVLTSGSFTADGATVVNVEFYSQAVFTGIADLVAIELYEDTTSVGIISLVSTGAVAGAVVTAPVKVSRRRTPAAGAHTYTAKAYRTTNNGTIAAGLGTAGAGAPGFIRITKV